MMEPFERIDIQELPLSVPRYMGQLMDFLVRNDLRYEKVDLYLAALDGEGRIIAGAGLYRDVIKLVAVSSSARSGGLVAPLVSRLIATAAERGHTNLKVFTKPENRVIFESLGFHVLAEAPKALLMENGRGLEDYCRYLRAHRAPGVIVMNANPFTLGHRYLVETAARSGEPLVVIPVKEDASQFPYEERLAMIRKGCKGLAEVVEGSDYQISAATFPTYFLKDLNDAADMQMRLDIDLFGRCIAPALGATVRYVGSEPLDELTGAYNRLMKELLPKYGIRVVEVPRLRDEKDPVMASRVRGGLDAGMFPSALTPESTWPYLVADLMARALRRELMLPYKPGLVCSTSVGAHSDMDYDLMFGSILALRRSYLRHREACGLVELGKAVEADVLKYTGGVNTYRGAIFSHILVAEAFLQDPHGSMQELSFRIARMARSVPPSQNTHGGKAVRAHGVKGALQMAQEGYRALFDKWLPYFRSLDMKPFQGQKTLLLILSELDDTCIIHRVGYDRAQAVKAEAAALLKHFDEDALVDMDRRFCAEGISPGGCADMLSLTIFIDSITKPSIF